MKFVDESLIRLMIVLKSKFRLYITFATTAVRANIFYASRTKVLPTQCHAGYRLYLAVKPKKFTAKRRPLTTCREQRSDPWH